MSSSTAACDWRRASAERTEDEKMRTAGRVTQVGRVVDYLI
jgi:hypothetical protein